MGITVGPPLPAPQAPSQQRGAARENVDVTLHGKLLTDGQGSPDVLVNDEGAWRERISKHTCDAHGEEIVLAGVQGIYINDVRAVRIHDYLKGSAEGDPIVTGSPDVFYGEDPFGLTSKDEFCKKFNELMAKWPTMTSTERETATAALAGEMANAKGMPAPTMTHKNGSATFNPSSWEMNIPRNHLETYGLRPKGTAPDVFKEGTLSSHEQCRLGKSLVHELRHQQMAWNGLRKIAENPGIESQLARWPGTKTHLPPSVWDAAKNAPLVAGSPDDTSGTNAVFDYYNNEFTKNDYTHTPGGSDAARHDWKVGCCTENR